MNPSSIDLPTSTTRMGAMSMRCLVVGGLAVCLVGCTQEEADSGVTVRVVAADLGRSIDAARSPDGADIYFLSEVVGVPALQQATDGGAPRSVADGLSDASSLVIASDGAVAVVAAAHDGARGLARVDLASGDVAWIPGVEDHAPRGLDLVRGDAGDVVVFTGVDPDAGPGVFRIGLAGAGLTSLASFPAAAALDGVAMTSDGALFVADTRGSLWHAPAGAAPTEVLTDVILGEPAGVALTLDESTLLISSLSAAGTSQVILLDTATFATSIFADVIGSNRASGGVHRALDADLFAWNGATRPKPGGEGNGLVYDIGL